jgi:hypothetical protein
MTPWQVRYLRWWYLRQAAWHALMAKRGLHVQYNLAAAARDKETAGRVRKHWIATGIIPFVYPRKTEAMRRMRENPRTSAMRHYDQWISPPGAR